MAGRKSSSSDFESRYFDLLNERSDRQDDKLEKILEQVRYTNGRVTKLESDVKNLNTKVNDVPPKKDLPDFLRDPKVLGIIYLLSVVLAAVVTAITKFDIKGLI